MSRAFYLGATLIAASLSSTLFISAAWDAPRPRMLWNASASAPIGLYRVLPDAGLKVSDLVAIRPPDTLLAWLAERRYLAAGVPLLKHVAGLSGRRLCRKGLQITLDGRLVAVALKRDSQQRALPVWHGCRRLSPHEVFLLNPAPDSMDGRYFGALSTSGLIGRAVPLLTRDAPGEPLRWRGWSGALFSCQPKKG